MSATLTRQRCWVHLDREAAARCPVCTHFYCRECVTEHEGRVICAPCLRNLFSAEAARRKRGLGAGGRRVLAALVRGSQVIFSVMLAWIFFQMIAHFLKSGAAQFHEASLWTSKYLDGNTQSSDE